MKVKLSYEAKKDIIEIYNYISLDSPKYARETTEHIRSYIHKLEYSPYIGRYVPELLDKKYRELIYKSYRIVYNVSESTNTIYIHFILHSKRKFKSFFYSNIDNIFKF